MASAPTNNSAEKYLETVKKFETGNDIRQIISSSEGGRAMKLLKRRQDKREENEAARDAIENETRKKTRFSTIDQKFGASSLDALEEEFKCQTVGLVSAEEFKAKRKAIDDVMHGINNKEKGDKQFRLQRKMKTKKLSFQDDEDAALDSDSDESSDDERDERPKRAFGKDPSVNTAFLYDADREADLIKKKNELIRQYKEEQDTAKKEMLEVTYSYWDGSGHRRSTQLEKGFTIGQFLGKSKSELEKSDFPELRTVAIDSLMYVKEDLIIPHNVTFYDLIKEKARGKSGPLFHFDVHDDVRMASDIRIEKDESHAGKIVDRKWYERNKHIFPACRWDTYSKDKSYDSYTISGETNHAVFK